MDYQVEIAELRAKAQDVRRIGQRTRRVEYGAALEDMRGALPGSETDKQIAPLSQAWETRAGIWERLFLTTVGGWTALRTDTSGTRKRPKTN